MTLPASAGDPPNPTTTTSKPMRQVAVRDLNPIQSQAHGSLRPGLQRMTDVELLNAVRRPERGDYLTENTRTGILVDGNGPAHELRRRMSDPDSTIDPDTTVPVAAYTPDLSMFPDLGRPMPATTQTSAAVAHRLLFDALMEIRAAGHDRGGSVVFHLADLFHTAALDLGAAAEGELTYEEVLRRLEEKARENGTSRWLSAAIARTEAARPGAGD